VSRNGYTFKSWPYLNVELAHAIRCDSAVLDGEIVAFDNDGRPSSLQRRTSTSCCSAGLAALLRVRSLDVEQA
jgi:ATP-dependent DNA ligase